MIKRQDKLIITINKTTDTGEIAVYPYSYILGEHPDSILI